MPTAKAPQLTGYDVYIRWMIWRDVPAVLEIEQASFEFPWHEDELVRCLMHFNVIGMVAEVDGQIGGYVIYALLSDRIDVLNVAVHPAHRRQRLGTLMMRKLINKLSLYKRTRLELVVRETNLPAQLFFRSCGLRAIDILRGYYEEINEDAYLMQFSVNGSL